MRGVFRRIAWSLCVLLGLACWEVEVAAAQHTDTCQDLAMGFATNSAQLDAKSLAHLGGCITAELAQRAGAAPVLPPVPVVRPPVPGNGTSAPLARRYGDWPPSGPWMENWPSPNPW